MRVRSPALQLLLAIFFVLAGVLHFVVPRVYLTIMPPYLPWHAQLVAVSGVAEILGGIGVLIARTRRCAGWGLMALLVAVFPANVHAIAAGLQIGDRVLPVALLWARLPLQLLLIAWVYRVCLRPETD